MASFPDLKSRLFISEGNPKECSHFAWGDIEYQFDRYIYGYKESADLTISLALQSGENENLDTSIFPACFMYRQYLELSLKDIYLSNSPDSKEEKVKAIKDCQHNLRKIWSRVRNLIVATYPKENPDALNAAESYVFQFSDEDVNSFSYRYPISKDLALVRSEKVINLKNLADRMDELSEFLSSVSAGMAVKRDIESDMNSYYSEDMSGYY